MPVYEYRCHRCDAHFEVRRPMADAGAPIACPDGHTETSRLLSVFAAVGTAGSASANDAGPAPAGGCACAS